MCGVKETQCTNCDHLQVCSFKEQFLAAQEAVDKVSVRVGEQARRNLHDFNWIKPVSLECTYFTPRKATPRSVQTERACSAASVAHD
jgi:hypothetical protein